jgi:hypothetical protein
VEGRQEGGAETEKPQEGQENLPNMQKNLLTFINKIPKIVIVRSVTHTRSFLVGSARNKGEIRVFIYPAQDIFLINTRLFIHKQEET